MVPSISVSPENGFQPPGPQTSPLSDSRLKYLVKDYMSDNHQSSIINHGISWYIMVYHLPDISSVMFIHISIPVNIWTSLNYFANHSPNLGPYPPILARVRCCDSFPGTWHEAARRDLATGLWVETPEKQRLLRVQIAKGWIRKMEKMDINGPITC